MIPPKKNKNIAFILYIVSFSLLFLLFYFLFNEFAIADSNIKKDHYSNKTAIKLSVRTLNLSVNDPDSDVNYLEVT